MSKKYLLITISWLAVLVWMALIFRLSSQVGVESAGLSTGITQTIISILEKIVPGAGQIITDHLIRKSAHFIAYLILGVLVINATRWSGIKGIKIALLICVLYASSDEVHQIFVPDRGPAIKDVFIDGTGSLVGVLLYSKFYQLKEKVMK